MRPSPSPEIERPLGRKIEGELSNQHLLNRDFCDEVLMEKKWFGMIGCYMRINVCEGYFG
ncbi:MAG: hypothetical protein S4CHLAM102_03840 [Chlamydiia bacterium]|nr:hypothetical protein [Chlamydiia bacterium]